MAPSDAASHLRSPAVSERRAARQESARGGSQEGSRGLASASRPGRSGRDPRAAGRDATPGAASDPVRPHVAVAVRVLPRRGGDHGGRPCRHPAVRVRHSALRRRPPVQLRRLRRTRSAAPLRPQRLRRDAPGPWEWDVKRLGASLAVAGRNAGLGSSQRRAAVTAAARAYREAMRDFAAMGNLDVWYSRRSAEDIRATVRAHGDKPTARTVKRGIAKARHKDRLRAFAKLACRVDGSARPGQRSPAGRTARELLPERGAAALTGPSTAPPRNTPAACGRTSDGRRELPAARRGQEGGRRGERRHAGLGGADARSRRIGSAVPPGEGVATVRAPGPPGSRPLREPGPPGRRGPTADAGRG